MCESHPMPVCPGVMTPSTSLTRSGRTEFLVSRNHDDFEELHDLIVAAGGRHPGIPIVRRDNDPRRDMSQRGVVLALTKLKAAGAAVDSTFQVLNHWR